MPTQCLDQQAHSQHKQCTFLSQIAGTTRCRASLMRCADGLRTRIVTQSAHTSGFARCASTNTELSTSYRQTNWQPSLDRGCSRLGASCRCLNRAFPPRCLSMLAILCVQLSDVTLSVSLTGRAGPRLTHVAARDVEASEDRSSGILNRNCC